MSRALVPASQIPAPFDASILAGQLAESSIAMYRRDFAAYCAYAGSAQATLQPETLVRWRAHLARETTFSPHTINRMLSAVKRLMSEAAEQGLIAHDLAEAFKEKKSVKPAALKSRLKEHARTRITPIQMRELCSAPDQETLIGARDAALLATLASSGVRVAEAASLTIGQIVQTDQGYLVRVRGKNDADYRLAPLSTEAFRLIQVWLSRRPKPSSYIFTPADGRLHPSRHEYLSPVAIWMIAQHYAAQIGLSHIKPHDFRRFVGTQLAKKDIRQAQKALGHKRIETTAQHYVLDTLEPGLTDDLY